MLVRSVEYHLLRALTIGLLASVWSGASAAPVVDRDAASQVTTVGRDQIESLPTGRRLEDLIRTCPAQTIPTVSRQPDILLDGRRTSPPTSLDCLRPDDIRMIDVFKAHNDERAKYGYDPLRWNPVLAGNAQAYANQLAQTGQLTHASRGGRGTERENISSGLPGWNANRLLDSWFKERAFFTPGTFPNVSTTGDWSTVGHYSQIIWPTTTDLGCGMASGKGFSWLVCRYDPGGNKDGKPVGQPVQVAQGQAPQEGLGLKASLFDLGIYGGGTWTADWYGLDVGPAAPSYAGELDLDDFWASFDPTATYDYDTPFYLVGLGLGPRRPDRPPPESILDDVGESALGPPPESILDDVGEGALGPPPESILDDVGDELVPPK